MPNRIIKESCRTSTSLDSISADAERLFWRLITTADDFGRFEADLRVILANCFPLKVEMVRVKKIGEWMEELCKADLVRAYSVNGKRFGYFPTWDKHQQRRAKHSKFPGPVADRDSTCNQMLANVPVFVFEESRNRIRGIEESKLCAEPSRAAALDAPSGYTFPLPGQAQEEWPLPGETLAELQAAYPGVDHDRELRKARAWLVTNPTKRKTIRGMPKFLNSWLASAQNDLVGAARARGQPARDTVTHRSRPAFEAALDDERRRFGDGPGTQPAGDHGASVAHQLCVPEPGNTA